MDPQRDQRIYELFISLRQAKPDLRRTLINQACVGDPEMRREIEALLAANASPRRLDTLTEDELREVLSELENRFANDGREFR